jgi:hypothetical protein
MNDKQRILLGVGGMLCLIATVFPPWLDGSASGHWDWGFRFLFDPPAHYPPQVIWGVYIPELLGIVVASAIGCLIAMDPRKKSLGVANKGVFKEVEP